MLSIINIFILIVFANCAHSLNVLVVWRSLARSHLIAYENLFLTLASKGHNVTVLSFLPLKPSPVKYREVHLNFHESFWTIPDLLKYDESISPRHQMYTNVFFLAKVNKMACKYFLSDPNIRLLISEKTSYDLVLSEMFVSNCHYGLIKALEYQGPLIGMN